MTQTVEALVIDLLLWLSRQDRSYEETIEAWRTSCPRLTVWEDANDHGLVRVRENHVHITPAGQEFLKRHLKIDN